MNVRKLVKSPRFMEVVRFGITGVASTVTTYALYYLLLLWLSPNLSFTIGYAVAFVVNYVMTVTFTFRVKATARNVLGFVASNAVNYALSLLFLNAFLWIGLTDKSAPIPTFLLAAVCNFFLVRFVMKAK